MVRGVEHRLNTKVRRIDRAAQRMELSDGGGPAPFSEVPWLWTDQFDMNMQVAGAPAACDELVYRGDPTKGGFLAFQLLNKAVVGAISVNTACDMRFARMLIASGHTVDPAQLANTGLKLQDMCR